MTYQKCRQSLVFLACVALLAVSATGCGRSDSLNAGAVEGTVTLDGVPLEEGTISFTPTAGTVGPAAYGGIINGKYAIAAAPRGPVLGKHKVQIEAYRDLGEKSNDGTPIKEQVVPEQYNRLTTLVADVAKGTATLNFDLKSK